MYNDSISLIFSSIYFVMKKIVKSQIEQSIKQKAEIIFKQSGLTTAEAIRLFIHQVAISEKIPFSLMKGETSNYFLSKIK